MTKDIVKQYIDQYYLPGSDEEVKVKEVWDGRYRADVWVYNPPKIKKSFFVMVENEKVSYCNPPLVTCV